MNSMAQNGGYKYTSSAAKNVQKEIKSIEDARTDKNVTFKKFIS